MKKFEELYKEILASDDLKKEFAEAVQTKESAETFLKKYDCPDSIADVQAFFQEKTNEEVTDGDLAAVSGGDSTSSVLLSILSVGIGCAITAIQSKVIHDDPTAQGCLE